MYILIEDWTFDEALYFCVQTLCLVGYGDLVPSNDTSRGITILYQIVCLFFVARILAIGLETMLHKLTKKILNGKTPILLPLSLIIANIVIGW